MIIRVQLWGCDLRCVVAVCYFFLRSTKFQPARPGMYCMQNDQQLTARPCSMINLHTFRLPDWPRLDAWTHSFKCGLRAFFPCVRLTVTLCGLLQKEMSSLNGLGGSMTVSSAWEPVHNEISTWNLDGSNCRVCVGQYMRAIYMASSGSTASIPTLEFLLTVNNTKGMRLK